MVHTAPRGTRLAARLPAFQHRNYRLFFGGQLVSLIGTWAQSIGQGWLVLELTNSPLALGAVSALQFTPSLLFGLWAGVLADRFPKRRILLCTQSAAMLLAVVLGLLTSLHLVALWHVLVLATLLGLVNALDMPTRQAFVGEMVGKEHLASAIALNASLFNAARVVGPAIAGLLIGWLGVTPLFWLNAASFSAVLVALSRMDVAPPARRVRHGGMNAELLEGLRYVRRTPVILLIMVMIGVVGTFGMNYQVLIPLFARAVLHRGASGYGFLMSALGFGSLLAALTLALAGRRPGLGRVVAAAFGFSLLQLAVAASHTYALTLALLVAVGYCGVLFMATANTIVQTTSPPELRGRVMSLYITLFAGSTPIGSLAIGALAHLYGAPPAMAIGAGISALGALYGLRCWWQLAHPAPLSGPSGASRRPLPLGADPRGAR